jgi:hypothetical protein
MAYEKHEFLHNNNNTNKNNNKNDLISKNEKLFAKKPMDAQAKHLSEILQEFFMEIGISKFDDRQLSYSTTFIGTTNSNSSNNNNNNNNATTVNMQLGEFMGTSLPSLPPINAHLSSNDSNNNNNNNNNSNNNKNLFTGTVVQPTVQKPQDMYQSQGSHSRQSMLLRMEHLFDEVENKLLIEVTKSAHNTNHNTDGTNNNTPSEILTLLNAPPDEIAGVDIKSRLPSKPVVIGDALPVPNQCPDTVEQLLEASLGHHNLGAFEEALKFLEAARIQLEEVVQSKCGHTIEHHVLRAKKHYNTHHAAHMNSTANNHRNPTEKAGTTSASTSSSSTSNRSSHHSSKLEPPLYFDVYMYIVICKGNVYQSCGDDEQSLLQYMDAWTKAHYFEDKDWEIVSINCAGILAFFSLRYEVSLLCFDIVQRYRHTTYGEDTTDTATALNNVACSLYCLAKRSEARIRFEKAWDVMTRTLGHRAPRCITIWKNLEKARRAQATLQNKKDMRESVKLRPDADRLIMGGTFTIQALPPPEIGGKKKKKGKGGKKKKK